MTGGKYTNKKKDGVNRPEQHSPHLIALVSQKSWGKEAKNRGALFHSLRKRKLEKTNPTRGTGKYDS